MSPTRTWDEAQLGTRHSRSRYGPARPGTDTTGQEVVSRTQVTPTQRSDSCRDPCPPLTAQLAHYGIIVIRVISGFFSE